MIENTTTNNGNNDEIEVTGPVSKKEFMANYAGRNDEFKYEWKDGFVETYKDMNQYVDRMFMILNYFFGNTNAFQEGAGLMAQPKYSITPISLRQPEFVFISKEQIDYDPKQKGYVPFWVAEIVAEEDIQKINARIKEYFDAGLKVIWIIRPELNQVDVYTGENKMTSCTGEAICSAAPVIDNFEIPAHLIFS